MLVTQRGTRADFQFLMGGPCQYCCIPTFSVLFEGIRLLTPLPNSTSSLKPFVCLRSLCLNTYHWPGSRETVVKPRSIRTFRVTTIALVVGYTIPPAADTILARTAVAEAQILQK